MTCEQCNGKGEYYCGAINPEGLIPCDKCEGTGVVGSIVETTSIGAPPYYTTPIEGT